jgi:hypothetical protein
MNKMSNHGAWNGTNRILCSQAIIQSYSVFPFWRETWAPRAQQRQTRATQKSSGVCGLHTNGTIRHQLLRRRRLAAARARGRAVREREGAGRGVLWRADGELLPRVCGLRVQAQRRQGTEWRTYDERATSRADKGTTVTRLASYRVIRSKVQTSKNSVLITLFSRSQPALITLFSKGQHSKYHFGEVSINSIIVKKKNSFPPDHRASPITTSRLTIVIARPMSISAHPAMASWSTGKRTTTRSPLLTWKKNIRPPNGSKELIGAEAAKDGASYACKPARA